MQSTSVVYSNNKSEIYELLATSSHCYSKSSISFSTLIIYKLRNYVQGQSSGNMTVLRLLAEERLSSDAVVLRKANACLDNNTQRERNVPLCLNFPFILTKRKCQAIYDFTRILYERNSNLKDKKYI